MFMLAHVSSSFRSMLIAEANRDSKRWGLFGLAGLFVAAQGLLRWHDLNTVPGAR